jgi:hypothetical protein
VSDEAVLLQLLLNCAEIKQTLIEMLMLYTVSAHNSVQDCGWNYAAASVMIFHQNTTPELLFEFNPYSANVEYRVSS